MGELLLFVVLSAIVARIYHLRTNPVPPIDVIDL
jgi:hypothetical protein